VRAVSNASSLMSVPKIWIGCASDFAAMYSMKGIAIE